MRIPRQALLASSLAILGLTSTAFAENPIGIVSGIHFPIVKAPEPSSPAILALYLLALVAVVLVVRPKRSLR